MKQSQLSMRDLSQIIITESQRGKTPDDLVRLLHQRGWPEVTARQFITNTLAYRGHSRPTAEPTGDQTPSERPSIQIDPFVWLTIILFVVFLMLTL